MRNITRFFTQHSTSVSLIVFSFFFIIARYPFYHYFGLPGLIEQDGTGYYKYVFAFENGHWPAFSTIEAGYPVFLMFIHALCWKSICVIYAHSILNYLAFSLLIGMVGKYYKPVVYLVAFAAILFCTTNAILQFETSNFRDSLYVSCLVFICSFFLATVKISNPFNKHLSASVLSFLFFYVFIVRPSAIFMFGVMLLLVVFFLFRKQYAYIITAIVPALVLFIAYAGYNYFTLGNFQILPGDAKKVTIDKYFNASKNEQAQDLIRQTLPLLPKDHPYYIIAFSKNYQDVFKWYVTTRAGSYLFEDTAGNMKLAFELEDRRQVNIDSMFEANAATIKPEFLAWYKNNREEYKQLWNDNIVTYMNSSKELLFKRLYASFYGFHYNAHNHRHHLFYYSEIKWRYNDTYIKPGYTLDYVLEGTRSVEQIKYMYREFADISKTWDDYNRTYSQMIADPVFKMFDIFSLKIHSRIYGNVIWFILFYITLIIAFIKWVRSRFTDADSLFILLLCMMHLGAMVVFCTTTFPLTRYVFTTEYFFYLVPALLPVLLGVRFRTKRQ